MRARTAAQCGSLEANLAAFYHHPAGWAAEFDQHRDLNGSMSRKQLTLAWMHCGCDASIRGAARICFKNHAVMLQKNDRSHSHGRDGARREREGGCAAFDNEKEGWIVVCVGHENPRNSSMRGEL